jgi:Na+-transporting methylmalonyl-CoA/oxaloacetate decarboxylase gamma subunit
MSSGNLISSSAGFVFAVLAILALVVGVFRLDQIFVGSKHKPQRQRPPTATRRTWIVEEIPEDEEKE